MQTKTQKSSHSRPEKIIRNRNLQIIFAVSLMAIMGASSVAPAFPKMAEVLNISSQQIGLLITFFTFPGILMTPLLGIFADRLGRKKILFPSLMLFAIAGTACAFVQDFKLLLALRFIQGIGASSLNSLNVTIIGDLFTGQERATAMGYNASVLSIGIASYPAIGGALAMFGWNYPFLLPVLAFPVGFLVLFCLNNPEPKGDKQQLSTYFKNIWLSVQNKQVIGLFIASVVTFIILYGPFFTYLPFLLGQKFGFSSLMSGLMMSIMSVVMGIISLQMGAIRKKFSQKSLVVIAFIFYGLCMLLIPFAPNPWLVVIPIILFGIGHGVNIPSIHTLLADLAPMEYRAAFVGINNGMVFRLGQTVGPFISGLLYSAFSLSSIFWASAIFALLTIAITLILLRTEDTKSTYLAG